MIENEKLHKEIDEIRRLRKKRRYSASKLNKYLYEIYYLRKIESASYYEIAIWLRKKKRVKISSEAIRKFFLKNENEIKNA